MKRDKELIRQVLKYAEKRSEGEPTEVEIPGFDVDAVHYQVVPCRPRPRGRLPTCRKSQGKIPAQYRIINLTWDGHDALDKLRSGGSLLVI